MTRVRTGQTCSTPQTDGSNVNLNTVLDNGNDGGGEQIKNIADPTADQDAATKKYVDDEISESQHYRGVYATLVALQTAIPTGNPGDYADVDAGVGTDIERYIWDDDDEEWIEGGGAGSFADLTGSPSDNTALAAALALKLDSLFTQYEKTDSYTLLAADLTAVNDGENVLYVLNTGTAKNFTVPLNATIAFPVGTVLTLLRIGAGQWTVVATGGVTITGSSGALTDAGQNNFMVLTKTATDTWYLDNGGSGVGDVVGPSSAVNENIAVFDTTTGKLIKDMGATPTALQSVRKNTGNTAWEAFTPADTFRRMITGATADRFHGSPTNAISGNISTQVSGSNTLRAFPWIVNSSLTLDTIQAEVTSLVGGSSFRIGIYADDGNCYPGALVVDSGVLSGDTTGVKSAAINVVITPGLYWLAIVADANITFRAWLPASLPAVLGWVATMGLTQREAFWTVSSLFGALPDPYPSGGTINSTSTQNISILVRAV